MFGWPRCLAKSIVYICLQYNKETDSQLRAKLWSLVIPCEQEETSLQVLSVNPPMGRDFSTGYICQCSLGVARCILALYMQHTGQYMGHSYSQNCLGYCTCGRQNSTCDTYTLKTVQDTVHVADRTVHGTHILLVQFRILYKQYTEQYIRHIYSPGQLSILYIEHPGQYMGNVY